jgi:UDP-N-acetylmuramate: L-alanyl-gamma-D-glutamyl-meso-diaminopimelate ligase
MMHADEAFVYYNPKTIAHKKLEDIQPQEVAEAFGGKNLRVFTDSNNLVAQLHAMDWSNSVLLMMSSGTFDGISMPGLAADLGFALAGA